MKRLLLKLFSSFSSAELFQNTRLPIIQPFSSLLSPSVVEIQNGKLQIQSPSIWNVFYWNHSADLSYWSFFKTPGYLSCNHFHHFLFVVLLFFIIENSISSLKVLETSFIETFVFISLNEVFPKHQVTYPTTISVTF